MWVEASNTSKVNHCPSSPPPVCSTPFLWGTQRRSGWYLLITSVKRAPGTDPLPALDRPIYSLNLVLFCHPNSIFTKQLPSPNHFLTVESAIISWCYISKFIFVTEENSTSPKHKHKEKLPVLSTHQGEKIIKNRRERNSYCVILEEVLQNVGLG